MLRKLFALTLVGAALALCPAGRAFSLQGPLATWMTPRLGYDLNAAAYGGPMNLGEEYRWNAPVVYYGFSPDFINYFGTNGMAVIDQVFQQLNQLPSATAMNPDAYPLRSQRINQQASALGILDLKSMVFGLALEQMGLANPTRYVYTLRSRWTTATPPTTNYYVIRRNFDPISPNPVTSYINGVLWTYTQVFDVDDTHSFVFTDPVDPLAALGYSSAPVSAWWTMQLPGGYFTTFTRDDIGGLKYIYQRVNMNTETVATNAVGSGGGGAWGPPPGSTNAVSTNVINVGLREGIERVEFRRVDFDSLLGQFVPLTNIYPDVVITNGIRVTQYLERPLVSPDILFHVADLQGGDAGQPVVSYSTTGQAWQNNDAVNGPAGNLGPGVINPGQGGPAYTVTFNGVNEILWNTFPVDSLDELTATRILFYGSFDGTTNPPVVYPTGIRFEDLESLVFRSQSGGQWGPPPVGVSTNTPTGTVP